MKKTGNSILDKHIPTGIVIVVFILLLTGAVALSLYNPNNKKSVDEVSWYLCAKTASIKSQRSGHLPKYYKKTWIQEVGEREFGFKEEDHDWHRLSKYVIHSDIDSDIASGIKTGRIPKSFLFKNFSKNQVTSGRRYMYINEFVLILIFGNEDEREFLENFYFALMSIDLPDGAKRERGGGFQKRLLKTISDINKRVGLINR